MHNCNEILTNALKLNPIERAHLIEGLMSSIEKSNPKIDSLWKREALERYKTYRRKLIKTKDLNSVLKKYN